jgi:hypothetical protein
MSAVHHLFYGPTDFESCHTIGPHTLGFQNGRLYARCPTAFHQFYEILSPHHNFTKIAKPVYGGKNRQFPHVHVTLPDIAYKAKGLQIVQSIQTP